MAANSLSLRALVVSYDTAILYELSWMLSAVGYCVETTKQFDPDALWRRYAEADFVLLDGRALNGPYESAMAYGWEKPVYWILLYDPQTTIDFAAWYGAGGHDVLRVPLSRGELLTRIRAGARFLEFERRLEQQSRDDAASCVLAKSGLLRKLRRLYATISFDSAQHTLLVTSIDWFDGIRHQSGSVESRRLVHAALRAVKQAAGADALCAYLGNGRFASLLIGQAVASARRAAEKTAVEFEHECRRDGVVRSTLTTTIVPWQADNAPPQLLDLGLSRLELARQSGGNCVFEQGAFSKELAAWQNEMATGNPFANVVAQDIMEPFAAVLRSGADQPAHVAALRRAGAPACPFVDCDGRLVGVASAEVSSEPSEATLLAQHVALPINKPKTIPHDATFPEIYETFAAQDCTTLVVVADGRPLGYLTCDGFLSLIEPIDRSTFAPMQELGDNSLDVIVASINNEPETLTVG